MQDTEGGAMPITGSPRHRNAVLAALALAVLGFSLAFTQTGCGKDEECLVHGENCTQAYKQANYGTTSIQCCQGQCTDKGSGILSCG